MIRLFNKGNLANQMYCISKRCKAKLSVKKAMKYYHGRIKAAAKSGVFSIELYIDEYFTAFTKKVTTPDIRLDIIRQLISEGFIVTDITIISPKILVDWRDAG